MQQVKSNTSRPEHIAARATVDAWSFVLSPPSFPAYCSCGTFEGSSLKNDLSVAFFPSANDRSGIPKDTITALAYTGGGGGLAKKFLAFEKRSRDGN